MTGLGLVNRTEIKDSGTWRIVASSTPNLESTEQDINRLPPFVIGTEHDKN
jgi:hypothetical protein